MKKVNILEMQAGGQGVVGQKWNIRIYKCIDQAALQHKMLQWLEMHHMYHLS